jgi:HSP20 family molecular chaperone IbpA
MAANFSSMMPFSMESSMPSTWGSWPSANWSPMTNWTNWPMTNWANSPMTPFPSSFPMPSYPMPSFPMTNELFPSHPSTMSHMHPSTMSPMPFEHMSHRMHEMNNWMRHSLPREVRDVVFRPMNMIEYNSFVNPIQYHQDGSRSLHIAFDVKGFKAEEVTVSILPKERCVFVEAKHEVKEKEHHVTRVYSRKFVLPEDLHIDLSKTELKSIMTPDGMLVVEALLPRITVEELKAIREKTPSKTTPYMPTGMTNVGGVFGPVISIPIKTVA